MPHAEFMQHLQSVHGIETKGLKASKKLLIHINGGDWYGYDYEWTIGEVTAHQSIRGPKRSYCDL